MRGTTAALAHGQQRHKAGKEEPMRHNGHTSSSAFETAEMSAASTTLRILSWKHIRIRRTSHKMATATASSCAHRSCSCQFELRLLLLRLQKHRHSKVQPRCIHDQEKRWSINTRDQEGSVTGKRKRLTASRRSVLSCRCSAAAGDRPTPLACRSAGVRARARADA